MLMYNLLDPRYTGRVSIHLIQPEHPGVDRSALQATPTLSVLRFAITRACLHPQTPLLIFVNAPITISQCKGAYCAQISFDG